MKKLIVIILLLFSISAYSQPFTNIQANESGLSVRTNLNNMINYINGLGWKVQYSANGTTWSYPWQAGDIYFRFSGNYGNSWTPPVFMWDGTVLGSLETDTLKVGTDVITGFSQFLKDSVFSVATVTDTLKLLGHNFFQIATKTGGNNNSIPTKGYVDSLIVSAGGYTDQQARDAVGGILDAGVTGNVNFSYDNITPKIYANVTIPAETDPIYTADSAKIIQWPDTLTKIATKKEISDLALSAGVPAGTGSELQYRANSTTFGALTGSTVTGANLGLSGKLNVTYNSSVDWGTVVTNTNSSGLGLAVLSGSHLGASTIFTANTYTGYPRFEVSASGAIFMPALTNASTANVLYYNTSTGALTYGAATAGTSPLTTKGDIYTRSSSADTRLPVGTNGQILSVNSATTTGLQWINAPSGSSIWTDAGTYAHLNGYEEIYMPFTKSISWRTTSGDVSGNNLFKIVGGMAALEFKAGSSDVLAMSLYNNNQAYLSNLKVMGSLSISNGPNSAYEDDQYTIATFSANQNAKFGFLGAGTMAQVAKASSPGTPASGWGYWYNKTDGKPYFKNSSGTEYDLSGGGGGGATTFLGLTDTPSSYTSQGGKFVRVNTGATALEFVDAPGGSGTVTSVSAGNGMNFTTITGSGTVTMGTPSSITVSTTNGVSTGTHTHALDLSGRSISTQHSLTGGGTLAANITLNLVNDVATPGNSKYYGTNSGGTRGWYDLPSGNMIYPTAGIPYSTGSAWGTSIPDNSSNWNTAFGWGNHATQGYIKGPSSLTQTYPIPFFNNNKALLAESNMTVDVSTGQITNQVNSFSSAAKFANVNSVGFGVLIQGGSSTTNTLVLSDYADAVKFAFKGSGQMYAPGLAPGTTNYVLYWDAVNGEIKRGAVPSATTSSPSGSFSHDASQYSLGGYTISTTSAVTVSINYLSSGMQGTIFLNVGANNPSNITVNAYSGNGTGSLTTKVIGSSIGSTANKSTSITYTCVGSNVYLVYGREN